MAKTPEQWAEIVVGPSKGYNSESEFIHTAQISVVAEVFRHAMQEQAQTQHEATWAMAMKAAATMGLRNLLIDKSCADRIRTIPCPPLQTTNEK